jgi:hypothetical protein
MARDSYKIFLLAKMVIAKMVKEISKGLKSKLQKSRKHLKGRNQHLDWLNN